MAAGEWLRKQPKYEYGVRSLYGLEGARIDYNAHGCAKLAGWAPARAEVYAIEPKWAAAWAARTERRHTRMWRWPPAAAALDTAGPNHAPF